MRHASQAAAVEATLSEMADSGVLSDVEPALVAVVEGLASSVDADVKNAALWREYRAALQSLREAAAGGNDDDTASFLVTVQTPGGAKVRNAKES